MEVFKMCGHVTTSITRVILKQPYMRARRLQKSGVRAWLNCILRMLKYSIPFLTGSITFIVLTVIL